MRLILVKIVIGLTVILFFFILAMRIWIGHDIKENIVLAKNHYPGKAEDALIAYLLELIDLQMIVHR